MRVAKDQPSEPARQAHRDSTSLSRIRPGVMGVGGAGEPYTKPARNGNGSGAQHNAVADALGNLLADSALPGRPTGSASKVVHTIPPMDGTLQFLPGRLEVIDGDTPGRDMRFVRTWGEIPEITFGRVTGPPYRHIQLRSQTVSRQHARMQYVDGRWKLTNLSQTNPVIINGEALGTRRTAQRVLRDGDQIEMGEVDFPVPGALGVSQEATLVEIRELESEYEILGELGRGGMAVVYLARDRQLGRQVAIKVIHAAGVDEAAVARQLVEARTVAQLQHPNVVAIYAVKRLSTLGLALVMQYIPDRTLERAMREDGRFSPERTEAVLGDIAAALAYAHARGVIHRDIKPDNIFLNDETGRALRLGFRDRALGGSRPASAPRCDRRDAGLHVARADRWPRARRAKRRVQPGPRRLRDAGRRSTVGRREHPDVMYRQKFEALPALADARPEVPDRLRVAVERSVA